MLVLCIASPPPQTVTRAILASVGDTSHLEDQVSSTLQKRQALCAQLVSRQEEDEEEAAGPSIDVNADVVVTEDLEALQ